MKRNIIILLMFIAFVGKAVAQNGTIAKSISKTNKHSNSYVIDSLRKIIQEQEKTIVQQADMLATLDRLQNTGYVKIATKKELQSLELLTKKYLDKNSLNYSNIKPELFNPIDIRFKTEFEIHSDTAKVLTPMPKNSYVIEKGEHHSSKLRILDIDKFWRFTKYLIIQAH